jgi:hypothetical protein
MSTFAFDIALAELLAPVLVADGIPAGVKLRVTAGEPLFTREIA